MAWRSSVAGLGLVLLVSLAGGCAVGPPDAGVPAAPPSEAGPTVPGTPAAGTSAEGARPVDAPPTVSAETTTTGPVSGPSDPDAAPERAGAVGAVASAPAADTAPAEVRSGWAAVYSDRLVGRRTASGEPYDRKALSAAHRSLPFGTVLRVTNPANGRSVELRINDRGPFHPDRILDLSAAAAQRLGIDPRSVARIEATVVSRSSTAR